MGAARRSIEVAVIGAGPGGYAAAFHAADAGAKVMLIDPEPDPGGVCLYRGCIPSKALLHVARVISEAAEAERCGVRFDRPRVDLAALRAWKAGVVRRLTAGLGRLRRRRRIEHLRGTARFTGESSLEVVSEDGSIERVDFGHVIVATGSIPVLLDGAQSGSSRIVDSTGALDLAGLPGDLLVVGGGYIGLELGSVYAALGSRVTLVEATSALLPGVDADLVRPLSRRLKALFEEVLLETRVARCEETGSGVRVNLDGKGAGRDRRFDGVLVAVGRRPNSGTLALDRAGIETDARGFIAVDPSRRTSRRRAFAIGDVAGAPMLAHKASHEGRTAVDAILGRPAAFEPAAVPAVVFTDPEIAWCGLTESEANDGGRGTRILRFPWAASGRAMTLDRTDGLTKLIVETETGRVLGVGLAGVGAGEMIAEGVLAVEMAATADDLRLSIHPHPTLSETIMEAADLLFGSSTHLGGRAPEGR